MKNWAYSHIQTIIFFVSLILGVGAFIVFSQNGLVYSNFDALSRLNISRKVIDNLNPGIAQFGNVWLPLPQLLMLPFIWYEPFWHNSLAGSIPSILAFCLSVVYLFKLSGLVVDKYWPRIIALFIYVFNTNLLLLQSMAMSESLYLLFLIGGTYHLVSWAKTRTLNQLIFGAIHILLLTLVRYEGYAVFLAAVAFVAFIALIQSKRMSVTEGKTILFTTLAGFGIFLWMIYLWAIFNDPFYWQKIYSHQKSIISTDTVLELKTFADQTAQPTGNEGNPIHSIWSYFQAVAYMSGIGLSLLAVMMVPVFVIKEKIWKKPYLFGLGLLIVTFLFIVFTLTNGGIPITLPKMDMQTIFNYQTNFENEYNIRYGLLSLPIVVVIFAWFMSLHKASFFAGGLIILLHVLSPMQRNLNLYYQLPVKWNTGSATNSAEDAAVKWFKENYTDGLILMSALKHDPSMFKLGVPYSRFIHEGAGEYWLVSREHPELHASWIYMNDIKDADPNLGREDDSIGKYLVLFDDWKEHFTLRYQDNVIVIYQRTSDYLAEHPEIKMNSNVSSFEYLSIRSIDIMQWSRDRFREWQLHGKPTNEEIDSVLAAVKSLGVNYVAIGTPYDEEFYPYLKIWVEKIHNLNLHIWFRGNFAGWEGWYDYPATLTQDEHLEKTYQFITTHPELFRDGDSFTACPECENGNPGDPRSTGNFEEHNKFLQAQQNVMENAFKDIDKNVYTNWQSMNGDIASQVLSQETVFHLDNLITIDHAVSPERMDRDIKALVNKFPNAKIMIGEYGAEYHATQSQEVQLSHIKQMFDVFDRNKDIIVGVNYWSLNRSASALINDDYQLRLAGEFLRDKYSNQK